jgi:putative ABC transport system substrate-binding protein
MRRREFIAALGGAAAMPLTAQAQPSAVPVVGFVNAASAQSYAPQLEAFLEGLGEMGYADGRNVAIEYRWAENRLDRLPSMVADLVRRQVTVIAATTTPAARAAKAATATIPIVFEIGGDPIKLGLVDKLSRPGGNVTGVTQLTAELAQKRLQLLHGMLPAASVMALLVNLANRDTAAAYVTATQAAARTLGLELHILNATTDRDFDGVFTNLIKLRAGGLVVGGGAFLRSRSEQLGALALQHKVPPIFRGREFVVAGGLLSYGASITVPYHLTGNYIGRILKGEKPADLPVQQASKFEFYINQKTAKSLGIEVPLPLLYLADEVIE